MTLSKNRQDYNHLDKVLEGAYRYLSLGKQYSQESFQVYRDPKTDSFLFHCEILSRVHTGEFLKSEVKYQIDSLCIPEQVIIKRSLGEQYAEETFNFNKQQKILHYTFTDINQQQSEFKKNISSKFQIATPAFSCSTLFSISKRFDSLARDTFTLVSSDNDWGFLKPFSENLIYVEYQTHKSEEIRVKNKDLTCYLCKVFQADVHQHDQPEPLIFYISKNMGIPYKGEIPQQQAIIEVDFLRKLQANIKLPG